MCECVVKWAQNVFGLAYIKCGRVGNEEVDMLRCVRVEAINLDLLNTGPYRKRRKSVRTQVEYYLNALDRLYFGGFA